MLGFQDFSLAGVQGLEPWARGFGDRERGVRTYSWTPKGVK